MIYDECRLDETARRLEHAVLSLREGGLDALLPLRVTPAPGRAVAPDNVDALVHPATGRRPLALSLDAARPGLTPTSAQRVARRLRLDHLERSRMDDEHAAIAQRLAAFAATLPTAPVIALQDATRLDQLPQASHLVIADMLDHHLERRLVRFRQVTRHSSQTLGGRLHREQERRLALLAAAGGDRVSALTCCPVAAAALEGDDGAVARLRTALIASAPDEIFLDGAYRPWTRIGDGSWRNGSLWLPGRLPGMLETALPGMTLSSVVDHPLLPGDARIVAVQYRRSRDQTTLRTDAVAVPLKPLLERHGITVR